MNIIYAKRAIKAIETLDKLTKQRIKNGIEGIPSGDIKRLQGYGKLYRLRIGIWRITFSYPDVDIILIEDIVPRGGAYKGV